jgi:hypothetical protein
MGSEVDESGAGFPLEGRAWCPRCDRTTGYTLSKVEFLGNPVKASHFCAQCGGRMHPEARDRISALRMQSEETRLRLAAAGSLLLILLLPLLLASAAIYLVWRIL